MQQFRNSQNILDGNKWVTVHSQVYFFENVVEWELICFSLVGLDFWWFLRVCILYNYHGEFCNSHEKAESSFMHIDPACHLKNFGQ